MLKQVDLNVGLPKAKYKEVKDQLGDQLTVLHRAAWEARLPVILVFEGWSASGKGALVNFLAQYLDPRGVKSYFTRKPSKAEQQMPWLWPFWLRLPAYGELVIFDQSWYHRLVRRWINEKISEKKFSLAVEDVLEFERTLADDGTLLVKFFLHIEKKVQGKRLSQLEADPLRSWRASKSDWRQQDRYKRYKKTFEDVLARTDTRWAPWTVVPAHDKRFARIHVMEHLIGALESRLIKTGELTENTSEALAVIEEMPDEGVAYADER